MLCIVCGTQEVPNSRAKYCGAICRQRAKRDVSPPAAADTPLALPDMPKDDMIYLTQKLNERLRAKGLPLITSEPERYQFVATGIAELDYLTEGYSSNGGFPRKRITEIFGPKSSGKSSLVKLIAKNHPEHRILFFDAEGGMTSPPPNVQLVKGNVVEDIMPSLVMAVEEQLYDLVILDSVASLTTRKQFDSDPEGKASMARAFGPEVKRLVAYLQPLVDGLPDPKPGTAVLFINQFRDTAQSFGKMEYTVGGRALEYYSSLRLIFRSNKSSYKIKDGKIVGQKISVKVDKNRFGPPQFETEWILPYDKLQDLDAAYQARLKELLK